MGELYMIDRMGYGIKRMNEVQAGRYLPLPDYDLSEVSKVRLTMYGGVVDQEYTRLLLSNTGLPLPDVLALDRVQKGMAIPEDVVARLRKKKLITGRKPHLQVAPVIAAASDTKAEYVKAHNQDDMFYQRLIISYLEEFGSASRQDINKLLFTKLGDMLTDDEKKQKSRESSDFFEEREGRIFNAGSRRYPEWELKQGFSAE